MKVNCSEGIFSPYSDVVEIPIEHPVSKPVSKEHWTTKVYRSIYNFAKVDDDDSEKSAEEMDTTNE